VKCRVCRGPAVIDLPRHNANFCAEHFVAHCQEQVQRAIAHFGMLRAGDRVLVAVSGGKDSLALWDVLSCLGYRAEGLYLGLGIGEYSEGSGDHVRRFAAERDLVLHVHDLRDEHGFDVPTAAKATNRVPCSACGLSKRHLFDKVALDGGFDALATGHNLDDEAAVLFGNTLRWNVSYLGRQLPVLPARAGFPRKVKPLVRLAERETAAYCVVRGIDYQVEECPMAAGNRHLGYKDALNRVEATSPGAKAAFYFEFLDKAAHLFAEGVHEEQANLAPCGVCGGPSAGEVCAFCRLADKASAAQPVTLGTGRPR
jgi:uncharacterized protein (TIGR00269 family)